MIHLTCFSFSTTSSLGELGLLPRKTGMVRETCLSLARFLGEVKLSAIFSFEEKNLPLGEVKLLMSVQNTHYIAGISVFVICFAYN